MITSSTNPILKQMRALRQRKEREATGLCFVEGIRLVTAAVESNAAIARLVVAPDLLTSRFAHELVAECARAGTAVVELSPAAFGAIAQKDGPQGLAAVVRQRWLPLAEITLRKPPGWVALVEPADPGNLGTICRTVDAVGASGVIIVGPGADPYDPAALRAAMGATFSIGLARATWEEFLSWWQKTGAILVGTSDQAPANFQSVHYQQPLVLLMGSERAGLTPDQQAYCDLLVGIPMLGKSDSLNLAVATGVMLYELLRQARPVTAASSLGS